MIHPIICLISVIVSFSSLHFQLLLNETLLFFAQRSVAKITTRFGMNPCFSSEIRTAHNQSSTGFPVHFIHSPGLTGRSKGLRPANGSTTKRFSFSLKYECFPSLQLFRYHFSFADESTYSAGVITCVDGTNPDWLFEFRTYVQSGSDKFRTVIVSPCFTQRSSTPEDEKSWRTGASQISSWNAH